MTAGGGGVAVVAVAAVVAEVAMGKKRVVQKGSKAKATVGRSVGNWCGRRTRGRLRVRSRGQHRKRGVGHLVRPGARVGHEALGS